jgi:uncharacterized protein YidB (DUF937 family)
MDPVSLVVAAVAAAAPVVGTELCKKGVADLYDGLKKLIRGRAGEDSEVSQALAKVEANPESKARREVLAEELSGAGVAADAEIQAAAQKLLDRLKQSGDGQHIQSIIGNYNAQADRGGTASVNIGQAPRD